MARRKRVTLKQIAANRANARRSTGPRTPEGKAAVRYNALTHGILAKAVLPAVLEGYESREAFDSFHAHLRAEFSPSGALEALLVEQIAVSYWRLGRLYRAEAGAVAWQQDDAARPRTNIAAMESLLDRAASAVAYGILSGKSGDSAASPRDPGASPPQSPAEAPRAAGPGAARPSTGLPEGAEPQTDPAARRRDVFSTMGSVPTLDMALKYARYETAIQNQLDRALSRLERLQRLRGGEPVPPPVQVDVDISACPPPDES